MLDNKKTLSEKDIKNVSGGCILDEDGSGDDKEDKYYIDRADNNKIIHKIVREDGRKVAKGQYCGGFIKYSNGFVKKFYCEKCGEWYDAFIRTFKEVIEDKFDAEIKD